MVGYPSSAPTQASTVLAGASFDMLMNYDTGSAYLIVAMAPTENMVMGGAYWVHADIPGMYVVSY